MPYANPETARAIASLNAALDERRNANYRTTAALTYLSAHLDAYGPADTARHAREALAALEEANDQIAALTRSLRLAAPLEGN